MQEGQEEPRRLDTARVCAKDLIRSYVLDNWTPRELSKGHMQHGGPDYHAQIGAMSGYIVDYQSKRRSVNSQQVIVTEVENTPCWAAFDLLELMAEIKNEAKGYRQISIDDLFSQEPESEEEEDARSLAAIFAAQDQEAEELLQQAAQPPAPRKQPAIYRSYMGGYCKHCGEWLGHIETDGGRDRLYCNNKGKCRQAHHRQLEREKKRAEVLQHHGGLRDYWQEHNIHGETLARLQEILIRHGKEAARAATDAVLMALAAQAQAGSQEQFKLMDEIMVRGEALNFPEVRLDEFRIPAGVQGWTDFVSNTTNSFLRQMRGYLYDLQQREQQAAAGRKKLEALSRDLPQ